MKKSTTTSDGTTPVLTGIGWGGVLFFTLCTAPALLPLALIGGPIIYKLGKRSSEYDLRNLGDEQKADEVAEIWKRNRQPGEKEIDVSYTQYTQGGMFPLPQTRTFHYELDKDDF